MKRSEAMLAAGRKCARSLAQWVIARTAARRIPTVLMYHSVNEDDRNYANVPPRLFERQIAWLKGNGFAFAAMDDVLEQVLGIRQLGARTVCLTFDDGFADNLTAALPILERHGAKAMIYVATGFVERGGTYKGLPMCDKAQLRELSSHPLIDIGGHTRTHPRLSGLPRERALAEILEGKRILEDWLGGPIGHFAYPYGDHSGETAALVREAGFRSAVTVVPGDITRETDPYRIGRTPVDHALPWLNFRDVNTTSMHAYRRLAARVR
jgi:peptidoglycan/xylan/chitin deacetylase (PgdA/CDA1 family)